MQRIKKTYRSKRIHRIEKVFHTEKYRLNLIEPSDPLLPEALNENTQKIEDAMMAHEEVVAEEMKSVSDRVAVFEAKKIVYGIYQDIGGTATSHANVNLGFAPMVVFVREASTSSAHFRMAIVGQQFGTYDDLVVTDNGFKVLGRMTGTGKFHYIAFG